MGPSDLQVVFDSLPAVSGGFARPLATRGDAIVTPVAGDLVARPVCAGGLRADRGWLLARLGDAGSTGRTTGEAADATSGSVALG